MKPASENERALREQGAVQLKSDFSTSNCTATASRVKALIVGATCWGLLLPAFASWLLRQLGVWHE